jgi:hypothetical protein
MYTCRRQSAVAEALRFLRREGKPQAIVKGPLGKLPEYTHRVQAGVSIGCSQSLQPTPEDNSTNKIRASQHLAKLFSGELFGGAIDVRSIRDGDIGS